MSDRFSDRDPSREVLSALADGQANPDELDQALAAWKSKPDTRALWHQYQLIGDVMRSDELAQSSDSAHFLKTFRDRLAEEPVVLASQAMPARAATQPLRRRTWVGPTAVAAGFVMVVGAMLSFLAPTSVVPDETLATADRRIQLAPVDADLGLGVSPHDMSVLTAADARMPLHAYQGSFDEATFSRPKRASAVLISDPRLDQALGIRRLSTGAEPSFAVQHSPTQQVVFEAR